MKAVVYARTSGEEADTDQDVEAQVAQVAHRLRQLGHEPAGGFADDGVSGDVPPMERPAFRKALALAKESETALAFREISRFSRGHPAEAQVWFNDLGVPTICLGEDHFTTAGKEGSDATVELVRYVSHWQAWAELHGIRKKTQAAMTEIVEGRRQTKSGRPPGRPPVSIDPAHLEAARKALADGGSVAAAHRLVLQLRGHDAALDPKTKKNRFVSRDSLERALGLRETTESSQNSVPRKTSAGQEGELSDGNGPLVRSAGEPAGASAEASAAAGASGAGGAA